MHTNTPDVDVADTEAARSEISIITLYQIDYMQYRRYAISIVNLYNIINGTCRRA